MVTFIRQENVGIIMKETRTIESFLSRYGKHNTVKSYRASVYLFLDYVYGRVRQGARVTKAEAQRYEELNRRYFSEERDHLDDLIRFIAWMNGKPPATIKVKVAGALEWLRYNDVEFTQRELRALKHKMPDAKGAWTEERDLDKETLKKILSHTDEKGRALILTLASSGLRVGEALQIKLDDLDLSTDPTQINVRGEYSKTGGRRTVFISKEAAEAIKEWLKVREDYLKSAVNRNRGLLMNGAGAKQTDDSRLFPFSDAVVRALWSNALKKAGLYSVDPATGRLKYRIHGLRKFFRSQLALSCPVDIVEALMGHEGYLTEAYRRYTVKQLGEYYLKAEHHVTIFESGDLREIKESLRDTQMAIQGYRQSLEEKDRIIQLMSERMTEMEKRLKMLEEELASSNALLLELGPWIERVKRFEAKDGDLLVAALSDERVLSMVHEVINEVKKKK
ncbi:MAG: site-specific integrase [Candidatus Syntrophoarchaeum sp. WYZ-LMO15]|nr:MAG: site-specific integrase [Candidatus Syntrophoarchaeum sp. WYZ-LMO15]